MAKFVLYQDDDNFQFRWKLRADNNQIIAQCMEGYMTYEECEKAIRNIKIVAPSALIEDQAPPASRRRAPRRG